MSGPFVDQGKKWYDVFWTLQYVYLSQAIYHSQTEAHVGAGTKKK